MRYPFFLLLLALSSSLVYPLMQYAGPLVIPTPVNGTNYTIYTVINDGQDETIGVSIFFDGDVAAYVRAEPQSADIAPGASHEFKLIANLTGYAGNLANITGFVGSATTAPGTGAAVRIGLRLKKSLTILPYLTVENNADLRANETLEGSTAAVFANEASRASNPLEEGAQYAIPLIIIMLVALLIWLFK